MITYEREILDSSCPFFKYLIYQMPVPEFDRNPITLLSFPLLSKTLLEGCISSYINPIYSAHIIT